MRRVVITGLGAITPVGNDVKTFWNNILDGKSGVGKITRFDASGFKTQFACEIKDYDPLNHFDRKEARKLDLFGQYGLVAGDEAIKDANLDLTKYDTSRVGVIFANGMGGLDTFEKEIFSYVKGKPSPPRFNPFFITKIITNSLAGLLSIKYGFQGVNYCPVTACASSNQALIHAFNYIKWGKAELILAGGSEAPITEASIGGFNSTKSLSTCNDDFTVASRPFDTNRDGFVMGEGAGALVVESLESALQRGAKIYAEIVGGGEAGDAYHITGTHPEGLGGYLAMKEAIREAGILPSQVNYINMHATSTKVGDLSEVKAVAKLVDNQPDNLQISATKSMSGHLVGAAGAIEAIATCMAVHTDDIPPTINTQEVDEDIAALGIDLTLGKKAHRRVEYALNNSFGFGGHCAAIAMKKYEG